MASDQEVPFLNEQEQEENRIPWELQRKEYMYTKMKYFRRLEQDWVRLSPTRSKRKIIRSRLDLAPPPHVLPAQVYVVSLRRPRSLSYSVEKDGETYEYTQSSVSTIFSIWNTMIGSTLVALPYGFATSGLLLGVGIVIMMGAICCYTCNLVIVYGKDFSDFGDLIQYHFGARLQTFTMIVSVFVLLGACIAYHILMQECLFQLVQGILDWTSTPQSVGAQFWTPKTAALMILLLYPITNLKNAAALVTVNSFGIPFVMFSIYFIVHHGIQALCCIPKASLEYVVLGGKSSFAKLGGMVSLSFFIHNAILSIVRNSNPLTKRRDVTIAYVLVGLSYVTVGALGYFGFASANPTDVIIEQNFLDAFPTANGFAFSARLSLFLQLATVYPLVLFIIRTQLFGLVLRSTWPNIWAIMALNLGIMTITTMFALFYPNVGDILRFTGAFGGYALIFILPIGIHVKTLRRKGLLTWAQGCFQLFLILIGTSFMVLQLIK